MLFSRPFLMSGRSGDGDTAPDQTARLCLAQAMLDAPWIPGDGVPQDYSEDSRFAILNDMTAGARQGTSWMAVRHFSRDGQVVGAYWVDNKGRFQQVAACYED